jgi:hypothetical protein
MQIFFILIITVFCYNALATDNCTQPPQPECAASEETYKNKEAYASCTEEFVAMSKEVQEYVTCLKNDLQEKTTQVQEKSDKIIDETNKAVKKFNCRANPKAEC